MDVLVDPGWTLLGAEEQCQSNFGYRWGSFHNLVGAYVDHL